MITGLGYAFHGKTFKRRLLTKLVVALYRFSLKNAEAVIFQNSDNADLFVIKRIVKRAQCRIVNGSGVNIDEFRPQKFVHPLDDKVIFLCVARLLKDKGLREYAKAASLLKVKYPLVSFQLIGPEDPSPNGISLSEVNSWEAIDYLGEVSDVRDYLRSSHVYVLPSYHEGVPRSTLEAMSIGRPVVTTNAVGCRETVNEGENGFMVDVGDVSQLVERLEWCILNSHELEAMGQKSVQLVKERFEVNKINQSVLNILGLN
jgi:glycosyltransferase involved in cell wall biosynthesis